MDKKNILIMVGKLNNGGQERVAVNLANNLSEKHNVIMIVSSLEKVDYNYEGKIIVIKELKSLKFIKNIIGLRKLRKIKKENNITHTISFGYKYNLFTLLSKVKEKNIITMRINLNYHKDDKFMYKHFIFKKADVIVPVSKYIEEQLINEYNVSKNKINTIYNFYEKEKIEKLSKEKLNEDLSNTVISVGRLHEQKGYHNLIKSFSKVVKEIPDAKLIILGRGILEESLNELIKTLNLEKNIKLYGFKENPYKYMKNSKIFVLSSFYEGLPNVVLEAMACGLPIISTDGDSGSREILAPNTKVSEKAKKIEYAEYGILVPKFTQNETNELSKEENIMADAIIELLKNEKLRNKYKKLSKERVEYFNKKDIMNQWLDIVEKRN